MTKLYTLQQKDKESTSNYLPRTLEESKALMVDVLCRLNARNVTFFSSRRSAGVNAEDEMFDLTIVPYKPA